MAQFLFGPGADDNQQIAKDQLREYLDEMDVVEMSASQEVLHDGPMLCSDSYFAGPPILGDTFVALRLRNPRPLIPMNWFGTHVHRRVEVGGIEMCSCLSELPCPIELAEWDEEDCHEQCCG